MHTSIVCSLALIASTVVHAENRTLTPAQPSINSPAKRALAYNDLGMAELRAGRYSDGESLLRKALTMIEDFPGRTSVQVAAYQTNLAVALELTGRYEEAFNMLRHATEVFESDAPKDALHFSAALTELSAAEKALGKFGLAEEHALRAQTILPAPYTKINLAVVYLDEGKLAEAEQILPPVVEELRNSGLSTLPLGDSIRALGRLRAAQHRWSDAASLYKEAIAVYQAALAPGHPELSRIRREYALVTKHHVPGRSDA